MVICDVNDLPVEMEIIKESKPNKYVIVQNHVREVNSSDEIESENVETEEISSKKTAKKRKSKSSSKSVEDQSSSPSSNDILTEISKSDIEELRTVYNQCKSVMNKIESKYGHLLNLDNDYRSSNEGSSGQCYCSTNKKHIFDEDGNPIESDATQHFHICRKKQRKSDASINPLSVDIAYEDGIVLPDDLQGLEEILHDPNIKSFYRHKVIKKMRSLRNELLHDLKFNKHELIEKLKADPDLVFSFKGTNVKLLPGYPL